MPRWTERPLLAVPLLAAVAALMVLPNLGAASLWDDDEGVNAGCTREMAEADSWIVPTFNWDLRTAKPILLYWVMRPCFAAFGETEFAARLPSAVAFVGTVLAVYALGRRTFGWTTGFVAGLIACSALGLVYLGRAATTDSLLILFTTLYFWAFWRWQQSGWWWVLCGIASGLAMLTKGPAVGLALPAGTLVLYLLWTRQWRRLLDGRMAWGVLVWVLVAVPWYVLVATETKGEWPMAFFFKENVGRASEPMEGHRSIPVLYELAVVCVLFAPWSGFLAASVGTPLSPRGRGAGGEGHGAKFFLCWLAVYFLACSVAATKLPHYIAPAYPALALLTARLLTRWASGELTLPKWVLPAGLIGFALTGLSVIVGLLVAGGLVPLDAAKVRTFPGLGAWAWVGLFPLSAAATGWWFLRQGNRPAVVGSLLAGTLLFVGILAAFVPQVVDARKAVKKLVQESGAWVLDHEVRIASLDYSQPSLTFYTARRVERLHSPDEAAQFLAFDIESYLFVPEPMWVNDIKPRLKNEVADKMRVAARHYDFYRNCEVLVVTNREK